MGVPPGTLHIKGNWANLKPLWSIANVMRVAATLCVEWPSSVCPCPTSAFIGAIIKYTFFIVLKIGMVAEELIITIKFGSFCTYKSSR